MLFRNTCGPKLLLQFYFMCMSLKAIVCEDFVFILWAAAFWSTSMTSPLLCAHGSQHSVSSPDSSSLSSWALLLVVYPSLRRRCLSPSYVKPNSCSPIIPSRISSSFILSFTRHLSDSPVQKPFQKLWQFLHPLNTLIFHVSAVFSALNFSLPSSWSGEFLHVLEASSQSLPVLYVVPNTVSRCPLTTLKLLCVNREHGLFSSVSLDKLLAFVRCMPCSVHLYFHTAKFICRREGWHQLSML